MGFISWMQEWFNIWKSINVMYHINQKRDKNHLIIAEKVKEKELDKEFDKV